MTWAVMFLAGLGAACVQVLFPAPMLLGSVKWPVLAALVMYYALHQETEVMLVAAVFAGFLQDALSPTPLGLSAVIFAMLGGSLGRFRFLVVSDAMVTQAFFGLVGSGAAALCMYVLLRVSGALALPAGQGMHKIFGAGIEGALCTPLLFWAVGHMDQMVGNILPAKEVEGVPSELE